jgi:hypothetical protein
MTIETDSRSLFIEEIVPSYREVGGLMTHRKILLGVYLLRLVGIAFLVMFNEIYWLQIADQHVEPLAVFVDVIILLSIVTVFYMSENLYITRGLTSRPLIVHENGLTIPPVYFRVLFKNGGFVPKEKIAYVTVRRWKKFYIRLQENDAYIWYNAPVEFVIHQTNGWRRRSGPRPPEVIKEAVDSMHNTWGVKVVQRGQGNGTRKRVVDGKRVELIEL